MNRRNAIFRLSCSGTLILAALLGGCSSNDARAGEAFNRYEAALNAGNLLAARKSLLEAVRERDDLPEYWESLGRLQLQFGNMGDAAYAFTRANELDRSNVKVLSALSELSLYAGDLDSAQAYGRDLEVLQPSDPAVFLVKGYLDLRRGELGSAEANADRLIAMLPLDAGGKLLKARVLAARGQRAEAIALLEHQAAAKPDDVASLKALLLLLEREDDWPKLAAAAVRLARLQPGDHGAALTAIEAAFRANQIQLATNLSLVLLGPDAPPKLVDSVLQLWARFWRVEEALAQADRLAGSAPPRQRLAYAAFYNSMGRPAKAAELAGGGAVLPVTIANSASNAIFARALAISGHAEAARKLFDAVLLKEPDHVYALRGRAELEISNRQARSAVRDAQRLLTIEPASAEDRLVLARAYESGGDERGAIGALWDAFHDIPANEQIYEALRSRVARSSGIDAAKHVDVEFNRQRDVQLAREFI
jgi:predicted Zn-dependent protease